MRGSFFFFLRRSRITDIYTVGRGHRRLRTVEASLVVVIVVQQSTSRRPSVAASLTMCAGEEEAHHITVPARTHEPPITGPIRQPIFFMTAPPQEGNAAAANSGKTRAGKP